MKVVRGLAVRRFEEVANVVRSQDGKTVLFLNGRPLGADDVDHMDLEVVAAKDEERRLLRKAWFRLKGL
jgi:hypothetical protein